MEAKETARRLKAQIKEKEFLSAAAKDQQSAKKMTIVRDVSKYPCVFDKLHLWYYMNDEK